MAEPSQADMNRLIAKWQAASYCRMAHDSLFRVEVSPQHDSHYGEVIKARELAKQLCGALLLALDSELAAMFGNADLFRVVHSTLSDIDREATAMAQQIAGVDKPACHCPEGECSSCLAGRNV